MRKTKIVTIETEGRDKGKSFLIREMPAMQAEKWAMQALLALSRSGAEVDDQAMQAGAAAVLAAGLVAFRRLSFDDAEPLLDEMMQCVTFVPDLTKTNAATQLPIDRSIQAANQFDDGDIEEVQTLLRLRAEVVEVHLGFSLTDALSKLGAAAQATKPSDIPTSPPSSESSSDAD